MSTGPLVNASGVIAAGGTSQPVATVSSTASFLEIQNPLLKADGTTAETEVLRYNFGAACTALNSYTLAPGGSANYAADNGTGANGTLHVLAATTGHVFIVKWR